MHIVYLSSKINAINEKKLDNLVELLSFWPFFSRGISSVSGSYFLPGVYQRSSPASGLIAFG